METVSYTEFLERISGLMGMTSDDLQDGELTILNGFFNRAMKDGWEKSNWIDLCPYGEARFVGNCLTYPNKFSASVYTNTALSITDDSANNPCDGKLNADKLLETSATSEHSLSQSYVFLPDTQYTFYFWGRYFGRQYIKLTANDGTSTFSSFFDLLNGITGTVAASTMATITQGDNGFYLCQIQFTTSDTATSGTLTMNLSSDGSTTSYAGDTAKGIFGWGFVLLKNTNTGQQDQLLPWDQEDESAIEAVFNAWEQNPTKLQLPRTARYTFMPQGVQFYSSSGTQWQLWTPSLQGTNSVPPNPVFVYYRKRLPKYRGDDYSAAATYAVDDQVYFTDSESVSNYYKCLVATTAGQSPETNPTLWKLLEIPEFLFDYVTYRVYSEWLRVEGHQAQAQLNLQNAERILDDEFDRMERQMGWTLQTKIQTHLSTQASNVN